MSLQLRLWLRGCVHPAADAQALEQLVRQIEDDEFVVNELIVK